MRNPFINPFARNGGDNLDLITTLGTGAGGSRLEARQGGLGGLGGLLMPNLSKDQRQQIGQRLWNAGQQQQQQGPQFLQSNMQMAPAMRPQAASPYGGAWQQFAPQMQMDPRQAAMLQMFRNQQQG